MSDTRHRLTAKVGTHIKTKNYGKERRDGAVDTVLFRLLQYQKGLKVHKSRQYDLWHFSLLR